MYPTLLDDQSRLEDLQDRYAGDEFPLLRAPGFKQFFDGVSSQHTAWLTEPYTNARFDGDCGRPTVPADRMRELVLAAAERGHSVRIHTIGDRAIHEAIDIFGDDGDCGRPTVPADRMRELVLAAAERGHSVRIHTIGDRAIHEAIDIFGEAMAWYGAPMQGRNTLEHLENLLPEDIDRLAELGILASSQPGHITLDPGGPERDWPGTGRPCRGATRSSTSRTCCPKTSIVWPSSAFWRVPSPVTSRSIRAAPSATWGRSAAVSCGPLRLMRTAALNRPLALILRSRP